MGEMLIIGQGTDYDIAWNEDFPMLNKMASIFTHIKSAGTNIRKEDLQEIIDPNFRHCLVRMNNSIFDVDELIEFFTFSDATIYHNREMHASIHQRVTILKVRKAEFASYLESVHEALTSLWKRQVEQDRVALEKWP